MLLLLFWETLLLHTLQTQYSCATLSEFLLYSNKLCYTLTIFAILWQSLLYFDSEDSEILTYSRWEDSAVVTYSRLEDSKVVTYNKCEDSMVFTYNRCEYRRIMKWRFAQCSGGFQNNVHIFFCNANSKITVLAVAVSEMVTYNAKTSTRLPLPPVSHKLNFGIKGFCLISVHNGQQFTFHQTKKTW